MQLRGSSVVRSAALFSVLIAVVLTAAPTAAAQNFEPSETIRVDSDLVDLQVSVLSHNSLKLPVILPQKDFFVIDDGVPQEITFFAAADAPFDLVLLLDLSGSTADKLKLIRNSAKRFVEAARPGDRIAIVTFTDSVRVVSPLTYDRGALKKAVSGVEKPIGGTNFWDALKYVFELVNRPSPASRRSAVVVLTDERSGHCLQGWVSTAGEFQRRPLARRQRTAIEPPGVECPDPHRLLRQGR